MPNKMVPNEILPRDILIEVCVDSVASAQAAQRGGANRIELCAGLVEGGITPSSGMIGFLRSKISLPLHVLIRPRGGDFLYSDDEFEVMCRDVAAAQTLGADGVVFGLLNADGSVDVTRSRQLVEKARPLEVTFHRAFDMSADLFRSINDIVNVGANRIQTSGGRQTALQGLTKIGEIVKAASGRIVIMPGSGVTSDNARRIIETSGAREIHAGLRSTIDSPMRFRNPHIALGNLSGREYERCQVLEESVRSLVRAVQIRAVQT